ncbi:MAG: 3-oxoacyl-ACP reductase FabG [Phycisphaerae bacterium]|nr:3-oxoacyl-ACP reductase FabG [Phycisphaerae bacterium]
MDMHLKDKVALVTGASHGLGKAICLSLAAEGAIVAVNYRRNPEKANAVVQEIKDNFGVKAFTALGDIANENDVKSIYNQIINEQGKIDILVNNAAVCPTCKITELTLEQWEDTIKTNLTGMFLTCREFASQLIDAKRIGRMVNISSQAAFRGSTSGKSPYDASKGGIVSFTISLAREMAPHNIAVNCVAPGIMETEMMKKALATNKDKYTSRIPLGRLGQTSEIADVVTFLSSDRAGYMTGATVDVSGGLMMR